MSFTLDVQQKLTHPTTAICTSVQGDTVSVSLSDTDVPSIGRLGPITPTIFPTLLSEADVM